MTGMLAFPEHILRQSHGSDVVVSSARDAGVLRVSFDGNRGAHHEPSFRQLALMGVGCGDSIAFTSSAFHCRRS